MTTPLDDIRVLVVAEDHLARAGLAALLSEQTGCSVVGQVGGAQYISSASDLYRADAIVWDLGWDVAEPLGLRAGLTGSGPPAVVLMADEDRSTEVWDAGARGVLPPKAD